MSRKVLLSGCAMFAALAAASPSIAQDTPAESATNQQAASDDTHFDPHELPEEIVVTAAFERQRSDVISGVSVLQGKELAQAMRPTIGETLARTPGVSATSFGPSASRPVLRGLQGERVRVLTDGIGSIDVSNTSVDHAVAIDPLLADRVEVLRGPHALMFGSSAIGGVVNVIDKRIPRAIPEEPVHVDAIATYGSAANERSIAGSADAPVGDKFVVHVDGSYLKSDNLEIGGYALSRDKRDTALANAGTEDEDQTAEGVSFADNAAIKGKLPNTQSETWTAGVGGALITDTGNLGVAYSHYDSLYGVPIRYATAPGQEQEGPRLNLKQDRIDARAEVETGGGFLKSIRARFGYADYSHFELEENGEVGTAFYNSGIEGRVELVQDDKGPWKGASGIQYYSRDFDVVGEEAFLPKNVTQQFGVFTLQQLDYDALKLEAGARYEHSRLSAKPGEDQTQFFSGTRTFDAFSFSGGASYGIGGDWRIGASVSRSERAPSAEELFANGPHAGTQAFEVGNPFLKKESAWGVEAVLRGSGPGYSLEASAYYNWFDNFIYDSLTGDEEDGLPVFQYLQADARYYGFEVQGSATLATFGDATIVADGLADYVHAQIKDVGPAPRIPPLRLLGGLAVNTPKFDVRGEVEWANKQDRITEFETSTGSYTLTNLQVNVRPWGNERPLSFALSANNIFDVNARRHASFLKDYAPLAGRDLRITARASF